MQGKREKVTFNEEIPPNRKTDDESDGSGPPPAYRDIRVKDILDVPINTIAPAFRPPPIASRTSIPFKLSWDGKANTFHIFRSGYEGWLLQSQQSYVLNPAFRTAYVNETWKFRRFPVTQDQVEADSRGQYGALLQSCAKKAAGQRYLQKHRNTMDGIMTW